MSVVFDIGHFVLWNENLEFEKYIFKNYFDLCFDRIFAIVLRRHTSFYQVQVQILNWVTKYWRKWSGFSRTTVNISLFFGIDKSFAFLSIREIEICLFKYTKVQLYPWRCGLAPWLINRGNLFQSFNWFQLFFCSNEIRNCWTQPKDENTLLGFFLIISFILV